MFQENKAIACFGGAGQGFHTGVGTANITYSSQGNYHQSQGVLLYPTGYVSSEEGFQSLVGCGQSGDG